MMLTLVMLLVTSLPLTGQCAPVRAADTDECPLCHMRMDGMAAMPGKTAVMKHAAHARIMPKAMRHCRIECCGHHDNADGLPHLLAPHLASGSNAVLPRASAYAPVSRMPALSARWRPVFSPPPRSV